MLAKISGGKGVVQIGSDSTLIPFGGRIVVETQLTMFDPGGVKVVVTPPQDVVMLQVVKAPVDPAKERFQINKHEYVHANNDIIFCMRPLSKST